MSREVPVQHLIDEMLRKDKIANLVAPPIPVISYRHRELKPLPNLVGIKISQDDLEAEIVGTYEEPLLRVTRVGPHECGGLGRYLFAGVEYPLHTNEFEERGYPMVYHVDEEWLQRGGGSCCPLYIYKNEDGSFYASMEVDS